MNSIRMTSRQFDKIQNYVLADEDEAAAFLVAGYFKNEYGIHFTVREVIIPRESDYIIRSPYRLEVSPMFFNKAISIAEANNTTVIQCHSHPFSKNELWYSSSDNYGERLSSQTVYNCLDKPMGSMLFGPDNVIGRAWLPNKSKPVNIEEIRLVDRHLNIRGTGNTNNKLKINEKIFDRQIRAFGLKGQQLLSQLKIGIVGVGGTGSAVAEQLVREGIKNFIVADHDKFDPSNLTRIYGSYRDTKQDYKVNIIRKHLKKIQNDIHIKTISGNILSQKTLKHFKNCDIIFSCTDRHAPRSVLNELAHQYFIPVIDIGVGIDSKYDKIVGGTVRVSLSSPSIPCLYCIGIIKSEQILAESLSAKELEKRQKEGYIQGMTDDAPSVITFTTMAAAYAMLLFKDLVFNLINSETNTFILDTTSFETSKLTAPIKKECACTLRMGKADYYPLSAP